MANNNSGRDKNEKDLVCSFCGKHQDEVERMIIGPGVNICSECIGLCHDLLSDKPDQPKSARPARGANRAHIQPADDLDINILTPAEIKEGAGSVCDRSGRGKACAGRLGLQPLQAHPSAARAAMWSCRRATCCCWVLPAWARPCWHRLWHKCWAFPSPLPMPPP